MKIIIIRHGQTNWNKEMIFRGIADIPLDDTGFQQVQAISKRLSLFNIRSIYSSPLKRACQTAQVIGKALNLEVKTEGGLIDFDFGEWQGLSLKKIQENFPAIYHRWIKEPHLAKIPGGENLDNVRARGIQVLNKVVKNQEGDVVLVSHRVINKVLILAALSLDNSYFWRIKQDVGAISVLDYQDGIFILLTSNDTCHLREIKQYNESRDF